MLVGLVYKYFSSLRGRIEHQRHAVVTDLITHPLLAASPPSLTPLLLMVPESPPEQTYLRSKLCLGLLSGEVNLRPLVTQSGQRCK